MKNEIKIKLENILSIHKPYNICFHKSIVKNKAEFLIEK
jgi:hypothetical protein